MNKFSLLASSIYFASVIASANAATLVAHWALEEGTGTTANDTSGNGLTGTIAGGGDPWINSGLPPVPSGTTAAVDFDGIDDQINVVGYKGITGTADRSVSAWIRTTNVGTGQNMGIVSWGQNTGGQKWTFRVQSGNGTPGTIRIEVNGGFFVGNTVVTDGEWHHVAVTWANDGSPDVIDASLYVDGILDARLGSATPPSASQSRAMNTASFADVRIGDNFQATHNWNGSIDDVRIYDGALTDSEVAALAGIPEPSATIFAAFALGLLALRRRR